MSILETIKRKSVLAKRKANEAVGDSNGVPLEPISRPGAEKKSRGVIGKIFKFVSILLVGTYKSITGTANLIQKLFFLALVFFFLFMGYKTYNMVAGVTSSINSIISGDAIKEKAKASTAKVKSFLQEKNATARAKAGAEKLKGVLHDKAPGIKEKAKDLKSIGLEKARAAKARLKAEMGNFKEASEQRRLSELSRDVMFIDVVTLQPIPDGKEEIIPEELVEQVEEDLETLKIEVKN